MMDRSSLRASLLIRPSNWIPLLLLALSLIVRCWLLEMKPSHFDEGINGHFVMQMWKDGFYKYDPTNFHGPLYFYFLQMSELIFGRGLFAFRFITVLFSVLAIGFTIAHRRFFGNAAIWAAAVLAVSPACVFYARYAIHEWLFILLQIIFSYGFFLYREEKSRRAVAYMTVGLCGTFAVKETFFVFFGTVAIAVWVDHFAERFRSSKPAITVSLSNKERKARAKEAKRKTAQIDEPTNNLTASASDSFSILAIGILAVLAVFSGFFVHTAGILDMFRAFMFWTKTGTAHSGHDKAFTYWLTLMWRYEWPVLIGLILTPFVYLLAKKVTDKNVRLMTLIAFGTWLAYSLIPYKTPWLILNPLWPLAFVFGFGFALVASLAERFKLSPIRFVYTVLGVFAIGVSVYSMRELVFFQFVNPKEPYVYVQSTMQFKNAMDWIYARVKRAPEDLNMKVLVLNRDTWPMPWTLSDFPQLTWGKPDDADLKNAGVILIDADGQKKLEERLNGIYLVQPFQIRDAYDGGWAYFDAKKFKDILPADSRVFGANVKDGSEVPK